MKIRNLVSTALMAATMLVGAAGVATADDTARPNQHQAPGTWYYQWIGPYYSEFGIPDKGVVWQKDFEGEVTFIDDMYMLIKADGSGDKMTFYLFPGVTKYTPSWEGVRQGSKVKVRSDDRHRVRWVKVTPFYQWLAAQTK
ncbi:MAG: hypothetical protein AB1758_34995 [Candidatus Eremiobacterota bacterium]